MEVATVANVIAVSDEIEMTDAAGSESYYNNNSSSSKEENVVSTSTSNNQEKNFELLDSVYSAAADGHIKVIQQHEKVLDQILTPNGNTILHIYITARPRRVSQERKTNDFVREILKMCPDLLWKANNKGETLLHMAARHGHADVVKFLLHECKKSYQNHDQEFGIKPTRLMLQTINQAKDTPLHEAVRYNHLDVVKLLTKADPRLPYDANNAGETPLYLAAERGYVDVVKEILHTCVSPADHGPYSRTALHAAVICYKFSYKGIIILLLDDERIQKNKQDHQGWTPLHFAAHFGYFEIVKKLMEDKSGAYKADKEGKTALHVAASLGKVDIMRELISKCPGCCELVDNRGWNALHFASTSKNRKAVRLILQNPSLGNLVNEKDEMGNTPFLLAASMRFIIIHPKVDKLVFNNDNHNASRMVNPLAYYPWNSLLDFPLWHWIEFGIGRCRRIVSKEGNKDEEGKDNRGDTESSSMANDEKGKNDLIVATLIATVTFAAGFTMPGGFVADKGPDQGSAVLTQNTAFRAFVILNTLSMFLSSLAVFNHVSRRSVTSRIQRYTRLIVRQVLINYAMLAMLGAFLSGTCAVLLQSDKHLAITACLVPVVVYLFFRIIKNKLAGD